MATFTCSAALPGVQPRGGHIGVQAKTFFHAATASAAAGDVVLGCKIPTGATVLDCAVRIGHKADTQATASVFIAKVGDGSTTVIVMMSTQVLSATGGTVLVRPNASWAPNRISLSDDAAIQYAMLKIGISAGTTTTSFSINGWVSYQMDSID